MLGIATNAVKLCCTICNHYKTISSPGEPAAMRDCRNVILCRARSHRPARPIRAFAVPDRETSGRARRRPVRATPSPASRRVTGISSRSSGRSTPRERATLERLLTYGPLDAAGVGGATRRCSSCRGSARSRRGRRRRPTSRATAALDAVRRIERGVAYRIVDARSARRLTDDDRAALLPLVHDRMTETVLRRRRRRASACSRTSRRGR